MLCANQIQIINICCELCILFLLCVRIYDIYRFVFAYKITTVHRSICVRIQYHVQHTLTHVSCILWHPLFNLYII